MNKLIILLFALLPFLSQGQQIMMSDDIALRNDVAYEILGNFKGKLLLYRDRVNEFKIQAFDDKLNEAWEKELELDKRRPQVIGLVPDKDGFSLFYHFRKKGNTILKVHKYDPAANLVDSTIVHDFGYMFYTPRFEMLYSEDRTKILLYYTEFQTTMVMFSFDLENMELLWGREFSPDNFNATRDLGQIVVDNRGNMHLVIEKDNIKAKQATHHFTVHEFGVGMEQLHSYNIPMEGKLTYDSYFEFDNLNQHLVAGGLYSDKNRGRAIGFYYLNVDPIKHKEYLLKFHPFEEDFIQTIEGKKNPNKIKGVTELDIQEIVLRRDGGILIIGERNKAYERRTTSTRYYSSSSGSPFIVDYYYDDLFVISIHPNGTIHWKNILHKKQYSQDDGAIYSSYFLMKTPQNLRFLFNDEIRHENTVSEYVIGGSGGYDRNSIFNTEDQQLRLRFRDALQVTSNELVVPSERRNRLRLVKVSY